MVCGVALSWIQITVVLFSLINEIRQRYEGGRNVTIQMR
jgi:hypothetical protein